MQGECHLLPRSKEASGPWLMRQGLQSPFSFVRPGVKAEAPGPTAAPSSGPPQVSIQHPGLAPGKFLYRALLNHLVDTCVPHVLEEGAPATGRAQPLILPLLGRCSLEGVALDGSSWPAVNKQKPLNIPTPLGTWRQPQPQVRAV